MGDSSPSDTPGDPSREAEDRFIEDPYDPQILFLLDSEDEAEVNNSVSFRPLSFVMPNNDNYVIKLASTRKLEELPSEEQVVEELVDEPLCQLKADGELPLKKGVASGTGGSSKPPSKVLKTSLPMFDAKLRVSHEVRKYPSDCNAELRRTLVSEIPLS